MTDTFAAMPVLLSKGGSISKGEIRIFRPKSTIQNRFLCSVEFEGAEKYNKNVYADDAITSLDFALTYLNGVRNNSIDPEFFWENGDSMLIRDIDP
jgi:hypothetical protein